MLFLAVVSWFLNRRDIPAKPNIFYYAIIRETAILGLFFTRCKIKKVNTNQEPKKKRYLLVCNHQSNFDAIVAFKCLKEYPLICVTKPSNLSIPVAGKWMRYAGFIPISRDDIKQAAEAISTASKYIKEDRSSICIFPEGKRNFEDGVLDFHAGSFKIAYRSKCPIVISSLKNTKMIKKRFPFRRTKVRYSILKVLEYDEYKDKSTSEIASYAQQLILEDLGR